MLLDRELKIILRPDSGILNYGKDTNLELTLFGPDDNQTLLLDSDNSESTMEENRPIFVHRIQKYCDIGDKVCNLDIFQMVWVVIMDVLQRR